MSSLAGSFLVAKTSLKDPNFAKTVVLLLAHTEDGAYGVVVNRFLPVEGVPFPLFVGGPCESPGLVLVHGHAEWTDEAPDPDDEDAAVQREIAPGIYMGNASCWQRATTSSEGNLRFRVFRN